MINVKIYYIYALVDPSDKLPHYVGMSVNPDGRMSQHLCHARKTNSRMSTSKWIAELFASGRTPEMIILEAYQTNRCGDAREVEKQWIAHYLQKGMNLVNRATPKGMHRYSRILPGREPHLTFSADRGWHYYYD